MLDQLLDTKNVATFLVVVLALVGGVVTIVHPETLSFSTYLDKLGPYVAGLAVGRGIASGLRKRSR